MKKVNNIYTNKEKLVDHICFIISYKYMQSNKQFLEHVSTSMEAITFFAKAYGMSGRIEHTITDELLTSTGHFMRLRITTARYSEVTQRNNYTEHHYNFCIKEFGSFKGLAEKQGFVTLFCEGHDDKQVSSRERKIITL